MPLGPGNLKEKIYAQVGPDLVRIEEVINQLLDSDIPLISVVGRYITGSGGKLLLGLCSWSCAPGCAGTKAPMTPSLPLYSNSYTPQPCCMTTLLTMPNSGEANPLQTRSGEIQPSCWSETIFTPGPYRWLSDTGTSVYSMFCSKPQPGCPKAKSSSS